MKKVLSLLLVLAMLATMLVGCGKTDPAPATPDAPKEEVAQDNTPAPEPVVELEEKTIQVMLPGPGKQADSEAVWAKFNEVLQEHVPNTTVEFTVVSMAEYTDTFNNALAAGEGWDLTWVGYLTNLNGDMADGNLMPLDELVNEYAPETKELLTDKVLDMHRYSDGELYYLLSWQGLIGNKRAMVMPAEVVDYVEQTHPNWLEETQAAVTAWWNEGGSVEAVYEQLDKFYMTGKDYENWGYGHCVETTYSPMGYFDRGTTNMIGARNYVNVMNGDNTFTVVDGYASNDFKTKAEYAAKWYEAGVVPADIMSIDHGTHETTTLGKGFNENTMMTWFTNMNTESAILDYEAKSGMDLDYITVEAVPTLTQGSATGMAVPYCADEPERGMMVLNAIYNVPELYQLLVYGFEGTHYTYNDNGTITHVGLNTAESPYGLTDWFIGTCLNSLPINEAKKTYYQELQAAEADAKINPFMGFVYDATETEAIISALTAVEAEYLNALLAGAYGANWEAKYDEFIAARQAAGVDTLIADMQAQLDAYIAANNITSW